MKNLELYQSDGMYHKYKIYNDGGHFVATLHQPKREEKKNNSTYEKKDIDYIFDDLYLYCVENNLSGNKMFDYIKKEFQETYGFEYTWINDFIRDSIKKKLNNFHKRVKRFKRKANLNKWNYFVTFTYDDKKQTEEQFKKRIRKCLSNLHCRKGWKYMCVYERGKETNRLHMHGLFYIPNGEMVGEIEKVERYSIRLKKMKTSHVNSFFLKRFGDNDFAKIDCSGMTINYILKYLQKTNDNIVYSRGIPSEITKEISDEDIVTEFQDFVIKYVLYDDVICYERDVERIKWWKVLLN